jgi:hypothetical protein
MKPVLSLLLFLPFAGAFSAERAPTVFLTHFYVALDQATYNALRNSPNIAALASVEEKHTVAGSRNWTGFYVTGRQTYMEFFGADALPEGMRPGDCGLALTVEESGGVAAVATRLRTTFGDRVELDSTPSATDHGTIPWFTATDIKSDGPEVLSTWFMEIDPEFLATIHPGSRVDHPLGREQYMSWKFLPDRPLDNVVGLTAALYPSDMSQLATELELAGWAVHRGSGQFVALGPDVKISVVPAGARAGIQQIELRLRHSVGKQKVALGNAELILSGTSGHLIFWKAH